MSFRLLAPAALLFLGACDTVYPASQSIDPGFGEAVKYSTAVQVIDPDPVYTAEGAQGVRQTATYRGDLHILVEAPDGTMASSTIMWLDEANKTAEFEPVGTHPGYRRRGLARAMLLHGMQLARAAGATQMTVACLGAPGHPKARGLYYSVGFREVTRDAPLIKTKTAG